MITFSTQNAPDAMEKRSFLIAEEQNEYNTIYYNIIKKYSNITILNSKNYKTAIKIILGKRLHLYISYNKLFLIKYNRIFARLGVCI